MHESVYEFVGEMVTQYGIASRSVIEVGSYNENGTVRPHFTGAYVGIDMRPGPGVDHVAVSWALPFASASFEVGVSTECLEHDAHPDATLRELGRVIAPEGFVILTARAPGYPRHAYPDDHFRFTPEDFDALMRQSGFEPLQMFTDAQAPGTFGIGQRNDEVELAGTTRWTAETATPAP